MMERTELREQFFAEVHNDPYAHMVFRLCVRQWADGYEQALRDHGLDEERYAKSFQDRERDAAEHLTAVQNKAEAQAVIAMASLGSLLGSGGSFQDSIRASERSESGGGTGATLHE